MILGCTLFDSTLQQVKYTNPSEGGMRFAFPPYALPGRFLQTVPPESFE